MAIRDVSVGQLSAQFAGTEYRELVTAHMAKQKLPQIRAAIYGHVAAFNREEAEVASRVLASTRGHAYDWRFWRLDTASVLDGVVKQFRAGISETGSRFEESIAFNLFQLVTLDFVQSAYLHDDLRALSGVGKLPLSGRVRKWGIWVAVLLAFGLGLWLAPVRHATLEDCRMMYPGICGVGR
ncbi:MAG: hypothetical protein HYT87_11555 [Nitrospirae bacterium]|nr:hypothetical protein [Nitrospirota bacterium]